MKPARRFPHIDTARLVRQGGEALVLLLLCALFGGEFFATRSFLKRVRSDPALIGITDNPQTAGGKADGTSASPSGTDGPGDSAE